MVFEPAYFQPDQQPASTLKDVKGQLLAEPWNRPTLGRPPLKEEAKDSDQGGGSTGFRDPATSKGKETGRFS
eukprot:jgi/Psemu1/34112/gm1.34112_g